MAAPVTMAFAAVATLANLPLAAGGASAEAFAMVLLYLTIILVVAKLGGDIAVRLKQPAVLGELIAGVALGNLQRFGIQFLEPAKTDPTIEFLSFLGVIVLLFEVGLESTIGQMLKVGWSALLVALLGVVAPFALGWGVGAWLLPDHSAYMHAFLGATLCATSVGITARVLKDLGQSDSSESRIILGAAVIDDVLGLVVLAVVTGVIAAADRGEAFSAGLAGWVLAKAAIFLVGALVLGSLLSPRIFRRAAQLRVSGVLVTLGLGFCFFLAWAAHAVGLAAIVGAFAAGLILEPVHFSDFTSRGERQLEDLIHPLAAFLVPVFFVVMGLNTDLGSFAQPGVLGLAAALTIAGIVGKQICGLGVIGGRGEAGRRIDRLSIGIGMIPRGEVGLIFATMGLGLTLGGERIVDNATFSAIVVMVIVTTLVTPPALKWSFSRKR